MNEILSNAFLLLLLLLLFRLLTVAVGIHQSFESACVSTIHMQYNITQYRTGNIVYMNKWMASVSHSLPIISSSKQLKMKWCEWILRFQVKYTDELVFEKLKIKRKKNTFVSWIKMSVLLAADWSIPSDHRHWRNDRTNKPCC